jgi:hypothetical protein
MWRTVQCLNSSSENEAQLRLDTETMAAWDGLADRRDTGTF